ncbi:MAG: hypothetical protein LBI56_02880 [Puniceicoccales bacterium]|nr:hypothetical protein [Puniceicoccales bacterium]
METPIKKTDKQKKETEEIDSKSFNKTVHMLIELLGRDMESANPSRDKDVLVVVREGLFRVEVAGQLFEHVKTFYNLLLRHFPEIAATKFDLTRHIDLTQMIAKMSSQPFASSSQVFEFLKNCGVDSGDVEMSIFGITQFIEMLRQFPLKFFVEQDYRLQIITAMQYELDKLIVKEELEETEVADN